MNRTVVLTAFDALAREVSASFEYEPLRTHEVRAREVIPGVVAQFQSAIDDFRRNFGRLEIVRVHMPLEVWSDIQRNVSVLARMQVTGVKFDAAAFAQLIDVVSVEIDDTTPYIAPA